MEAEILRTAIDQINKHHNVHCRILGTETYYGGRRVDAQIQLKIGKEEVLLNAEVKSKVVPAQIPTIIDIKKEANNIMIIAHYITPKAKEILKKEQIPYADTAGNIYLCKNGIYIFIDSKKPNLEKIESKGRAFTMAGLKVVYQFLMNPEYINQTYRFIGKKAQVTIRTVGKTLEGLINEKLILRENKKKYVFVNQKDLLHRWVTEYNKTLRPKLTKRRFRWRTKAGHWQNTKLPHQTFWGGPAAAEIMTDHLIADKWTIYTGLDFVEIINTLELVPDKNGNVEVVQKFWNDTEDNPQDTVHPILVYADLIEAQNSRYIETAKYIYKEYVENNL